MFFVLKCGADTHLIFEKQISWAILFSALKPTLRSNNIFNWLLLSYEDRKERNPHILPAHFSYFSSHAKGKVFPFDFSFSRQNGNIWPVRSWKCQIRSCRRQQWKMAIRSEFARKEQWQHIGNVGFLLLLEFFPICWEITVDNIQFSLCPAHSQKFSDSEDYINQWNSFPPGVVEAPSLEIFKTRLGSHLTGMV